MVHRLKEERKAIAAWCIYDWGISAFPVIVTTFVFAPYFTSTIAINSVEGTKHWGISMAVAGIIIACLSPVTGAIADYHGRRKWWLGVITFLLIFSSVLLWYAQPKTSYAIFTLICVAFGTINLNLSMVFYNALLPDLVPRDFVGRISGLGWGLGYCGGLLALIIALVGFIFLKPSWLDIKQFEQIRLCGPLVGLWIFIFTLPLFLFVPDHSFSRLSLPKAVQFGFLDLVPTIRELIREKRILIFLIAQMIYMDGLNSLFLFAGIYAVGTFQLDVVEVLFFGIAMNACAGLGSFMLAWVDDLIGPKKTVLLSLAFLIFFGLAIVLITSKLWFFILGSLLSLFVGPVQSSSRSLMVQLIPKEKATKMFGFYSLSGKLTTFVGPWLVGLITYYANSQRVGMSTVLLFFIGGAIILLAVNMATSRPTNRLS